MYHHSSSKTPVKRASPWTLPFLLLSLVLGVGACGSEGGGDIDASSQKTGMMRVSVTDSTATGATQRIDGTDIEMDSVTVVVSSVEVHRADADDDSGWFPIAGETGPISLTDLAAGVRAELGVESLPVGDYDQIRLHLNESGNVFVDGEGNVHALKVPSGTLKLVGEFTVAEDQTTDLLLDFDANKSIVHTGSGKFILKPVIRISGETVVETTATLGGHVRDADTGLAVAGASVSVQLIDSAAIDVSDRVKIAAAATTDAEGGYSLELDPGDYVIVVTASGYLPAAAAASLAAGEDRILDFSLAGSDSNGTLVLSLTVPEGSLDFTANLSLRATLTLDDGSEAQVEVASVELQSGASASLELPAGEYVIVASLDGFPDLSLDASVAADVETSLDIQFQ